MTVTIKKSLTEPFGELFGVAAAAYASELKAWRAHMDRVAQDRANGVPNDDAHHEYPAPHAHPLVVSTINESGDPDYVIEDDGPTPEQILAAKRAALAKQTIEIADAAALAILPKGKALLLGLQVQDIHEDDAWRLTMQQALVSEKVMALEDAQSKLAAMPNDGLLKRLLNPNPDRDTLANAVKAAEAEASDAMKPLADPVRFHTDNRPAKDNKLLAGHKNTQAQLRQIQRWSAQVQSDIDDLTVDTVDTWDMPPLPT